MGGGRWCPCGQGELRLNSSGHDSLSTPETYETLAVPIKDGSPWTSHGSSLSPHFLIYKIGKMDWVVKIT